MTDPMARHGSAPLDAAARSAPLVTPIELVPRTGNAAAIRRHERLEFDAEGRFAARVRLADGPVEDDIPRARVSPSPG